MRHIRKIQTLVRIVKLFSDKILQETPFRNYMLCAVTLQIFIHAISPVTANFAYFIVKYFNFKLIASITLHCGA